MSISEKPPAPLPARESPALPEFELPDMSIVPMGQIFETMVRVPMNFKGKDMRFNFKFIRERAVPESDFHGGIELKITDSTVRTFLELASFHCDLKEEKITPREYSGGDKTKHRYWNFFNRLVYKTQRQQGLAEYSILAVEDLIRKLAEKYPTMQYEWIQMDTKLTSVSRLIVDQEWLKEHGLGHLAKKHGTDFHYLPHPRDTERAIALLQASLVERKDSSEAVPPVRYIK